MPPALVLLLVFVLAAVILGATGVFVLVGFGWTLIFLAAACLAVAVVISRGMSNG